MFILLVACILVSMNGIRQVLAAAIIFTATKYLIEGNWIKYLF